MNGLKFQFTATVLQMNGYFGAKIVYNEIIFHISAVIKLNFSEIGFMYIMN